MATTVELPTHGAATRAIHWGSALLVLSAWAVGSTMEEFPRGAGRDAAMQLHYSLGVLVLGLAALRVAWREQDRGASAVELAVITAMILVVAVVLLVAIQHFVRGAAKQIKGTTP